MVTKQEREDAERRIEASNRLEEIFDELEIRYGIKREDVPKYLDAIRWVIEHRQHWYRIGWTVILGMIGLAATGLAKAIWDGMRMNLK